MLVFLLLVDTAGQERCSLKEEKASFEGNMIYDQLMSDLTCHKIGVTWEKLHVFG